MPSLIQKYADTFLMDAVPEEEGETVASEVADWIFAILKQETRLEGAVHRGVAA